MTRGRIDWNTSGHPSNSEALVVMTNMGEKAQQLWIGMSDQDNKIYAWLDEKTGFISAHHGGPYNTPLYRRPRENDEA